MSNTVLKSDAWPTAVLFDLDGTLVDSAPDLATSTNLLLAQYGYEPISLPEAKGMIGNGVAKLVERAFAARGVALDDDLKKSRTDEMMVFYNQHLTDQTDFLTGAKEAIMACADKGILIGVVTNKPEAASKKILSNLGVIDLLGVVVGGDTCATRKPKPEMLFHATNKLGVTIDETIIVGDSPADIGAAKAANMRSIAVRGGYTSVPVEELGATTVIESMFDLMSAIEPAK